MRRAALVLVVGAACGGDARPATPSVGLPATLPLPYVAAGAGATQLAVPLTNRGDADATLTWRLDGDPAFALVAAPDRLAAGATATLGVRWAGADTPRIAGATLALTVDAAPAIGAEIWAVAGDPALPEPTFAPVAHPGDPEVVIGASAVVAMPTAPFPATGRPWTDPRVHLFVPADYRELDAHDVVLHFHGHGTTVDATVPAHRYREQLWASGVNAVLVVPQGPVNAASGDFGKLMDPAGTAAFLDEAITVLYRAGAITRPVLGDVVLTSHSGGYQAVAANLEPAGPFAVPQVHLFDSLYGFVARYGDFVRAGGRLRSSYTAGGGTDGNNQALAAGLASTVPVADAPTAVALRDAAAVIYFTAASHGGCTRDGAAFAEALRWSRLPGRRGPRAELRAVTEAGGVATIRWLAPATAGVAGWRVETSRDGVGWDVAAEAAATGSSATVPLASMRRVRVRPILDGDPAAATQPSDVYAVAPAARILVVDGFDRVVDGSWAALSHDLAARIGDAAGAVHTVSDEAVTEDGVALAPYRVVIWLVGDESTDDHTVTPAARAAIDAYVAGGGRVILSGSELGYDLGPTAAGAAWLASLAGAIYAADDAGTSTAAGAGPLAAVAGFTFGGAGAPYAEDFPDTFTTTGAGVALVRYATGGAAAVGIPGRAAVVGFPLEVIDERAAQDALVDALVAFVGP